MLLTRIETLFNVAALREECKKMGSNFITAGIVGVFINHYVGTQIPVMLWSAGWVTFIGMLFLMIGTWNSKGEP